MKNIPFHEGEIVVQERAGVAASARKVGAIIHDTLPDAAAAFLRAQRFVILAAADEAGQMWASPLVGPPGFIFASNETTVYATARPLPDNLLPESVSVPAGLLAIDLSTRRRMRVNGQIERSGDHLRLKIAQAYSNCPKYIQARDAEPFPTSEPRGQTVVSERLTKTYIAWIRAADTFFIATRQPNGDADASHRGGAPGFVTVTDAGALLWNDFPGNNMFNTLGNLALDPHAGLLFIDFVTGDALQMSGTARILWNETERQVEFSPQRIAQTSAALPLHWNLREYSPFNP